MIDAALAERSETNSRGGGGRFAALGLALGVVASVAAAYVGSALLFADFAALFDASDPSRLDRVFRFNAILTLVIAFTAAVLSADRRSVARDLAELRAVVEASEREWAAWSRRVFQPSGGRLVAVLGCGAAVGVAIVLVARALASAPPPDEAWGGHDVWTLLLNPPLFALLALLALRSIGRARVLSELGRRVRVRLVDPSDLRPFARAGLRGAIHWFLGSSIASLLVIESDTPWLVTIVLAVTVGLGICSLLLPSQGAHQSLRAAKRAELDWVRAEIERAREALAQPTAADAALAASLPPLLAYEARVASVREWPFDAPTLARFLVFLLVPLGSWLGGALVERLVDAFLD